MGGTLGTCLRGLRKRKSIGKVGVRKLKAKLRKIAFRYKILRLGFCCGCVSTAELGSLTLFLGSSVGKGWLRVVLPLTSAEVS